MQATRGGGFQACRMACQTHIALNRAIRSIHSRHSLKTGLGELKTCRQTISQLIVLSEKNKSICRFTPGPALFRLGHEIGVAALRNGLPYALHEVLVIGDIDP